MNDVAIKVENVSKIYKLYENQIDRLKESLNISRKKYHKEYYALDNISFEINKGDAIGIIGTNGSGKSTLLKIITGVLTPNKGTVSVNGKISALLELGAGFNPEYTGIQNIYLNGSITGYSTQEIDEKISDIISFADIGNFINQPVKTYSSGMFARLAFAVAINIDPEILIVDEALSVGDVFFQSKCYKKFEEFKSLGKTIIFVSHDLGSITKYCDRVFLLNRGDFLAEGSPREVIDIYKKLLVNQLDRVDSNPKVNTKKLAIEWKKLLEISPNKLEYGNEKAKIIDFGVFDDNENITCTIMKDKKFAIKMKVEFYSEIKEPIFAFTIKDVKGTEITGTNTMLERISTGDNKRGNIVEVVFTQEMNLQGNVYLLSLGCTGYEEGKFEVYHRLYDICSIAVIAEKNTVGFYDMNSIVQIN
jgi:teichoic acid transport system ATP-binding protein